jgi:hypothetical protein
MYPLADNSGETDRLSLLSADSYPDTRRATHMQLRSAESRRPPRRLYDDLHPLFRHGGAMLAVPLDPA